MKVPDARVDSLAALYDPKKTTYAEITFSDLGAGKGEGLDRTALDAMRDVDALCQVFRAFPDAAGEPAIRSPSCAGSRPRRCSPTSSSSSSASAKLTKDRSNPRELALLERMQQALEGGRAVRSLELSEEELKSSRGTRF